MRDYLSSRTTFSLSCEWCLQTGLTNKPNLNKSDKKSLKHNQPLMMDAYTDRWEVDFKTSRSVLKILSRHEILNPFLTFDGCDMDVADSEHICVKLSKYQFQIYGVNIKHDKTRQSTPAQQYTPLSLMVQN